MARIRSIRPELPHDRDFGRLPIPTRYHYVILKTVADDAGYFRAEPRTLAGQLYPYDRNLTEAEIDRHGALLKDAGLLEFRETPEGLIGRIVKWHEERVDHPSRSYLQPLFEAAAPAPSPAAPEDGLLRFPPPAAPAPAPAVSDYALTVVCAINGVFHERMAGGNRPLVATIEAPVAERWRDLGVPLDLAKQTCLDVAQRFQPGPRGKQPNGLTYFDRAVLEAFERSRTPAPDKGEGEVAGLRRLLAKAKRDGDADMVAHLENRIAALAPREATG